MSDLPTTHEMTDVTELSYDNDEVRASTGDAANGLADAKKNRLYSNSRLGNNMLQTRSNATASARYQQMNRGPQ